MTGQTQLEVEPTPLPATETRSAGVATATFAAVEAIALALWMFVGRFQWFRYDDWDFLAARKAGDLGDLFRPHNEHWTTIPVLAYRALYWLFGLRSFFAYRLMVVLVHLTAVALLFVIMRRAGVRPWIATAAASAMALFGAGAQDIVLPVQICFTGALTLGLAHLLLADHDGPVDRRDWLGLLAGLIGLMFSAIAVSMVVVVGIAVFLRRGWRLAAFHTAPLAACYLVWFLAIGHTGYTNGNPSVGRISSFVAAGLGAVPRALVRNPDAFTRTSVFLVVIGIVVIAGLALTLTERRHSGRVSQLAVPIAMLAGCVVLLAVTATGRSNFGAGYARAARYVYLLAAMMLPTLALAADGLIRRWRWLLPIAVALFLVGVPANIRTATHTQNGLKSFYAETRRMVLSLPRNPLARKVPRSLRPEPLHSASLTIGWLLDGVAQHRIPAPTGTSPSGFAEDNFRLSFGQQRGRSPTTRCRSLHRPVSIALEQGDVIGLYDNAILLAATDPKLSGYLPLLFFPADGTRLVVLHTPRGVRLSAVASDLNWRATRDDTGVAPRVCVARHAQVDVATKGAAHG